MPHALRGISKQANVCTLLNLFKVISDVLRGVSDRVKDARELRLQLDELEAACKCVCVCVCARALRAACS